jgi:predicted transposase YdaD
MEAKVGDRKTHLHMTGENGTLIMDIRGKNSGKVATKVQNEMKKLGLHVKLREDAKVIEVRSPASEPTPEGGA